MYIYIYIYIKKDILGVFFKKGKGEGKHYFSGGNELNWTYGVCVCVCDIM